MGMCTSESMRRMEKRIQVGIDSRDVKDMNYADNLKPIHLDGKESIPAWILFFHSTN